MSIWTKAFWVAALERAIKTAAGSSVIAAFFQGTSFWAIDWKQFTGLVLGTVFLSLLMSISSSGVGKSDGPSLANERIEP